MTVEPDKLDSLGKAYEEHRGDILRVHKSRVGDVTIAEDLTQETFLRAMEGLGSYEEKGMMAHWLSRIARNRAVDQSRKREPVEVPLSGQESEDEPFDLGVDLAPGQLEKAIARLAPRQRAVLQMKVVEELKYSEIRDRLGSDKSRITYRVLKHRAIRRLRRLLTEQPKKPIIRLAEPPMKTPVARFLRRDSEYLSLRRQFVKAIDMDMLDDNGSAVGDDLVDEARYYEGRHGIFAQAAERRRTLIASPVASDFTPPDSLVGLEAASVISTVGGLVIDHNEGFVSLDGFKLHLAPREFRVVSLLAINAGKVVANEYLIRNIWNSPPPEPLSNMLRMSISRLRKSLDQGRSLNFSYIKTIQDFGYMMVDPTQRQD